MRRGRLPSPRTCKVAAWGGYLGRSQGAPAANRTRTRPPSVSSRSRLLLSRSSPRARRHLHARRGARRPRRLDCICLGRRRHRHRRHRRPLRRPPRSVARGEARASAVFVCVRAATCAAVGTAGCRRCCCVAAQATRPGRTRLTRVVCRAVAGPSAVAARPPPRADPAVCGGRVAARSGRNRRRTRAGGL